MPKTTAVFSLDAETVPLQEDFRDLPTELATRVDILVTDLLASDVVQSMTLVCLRHPDDDPNATTSIAKTITPTPSSDGVIAATTDPTVRLAEYQLSLEDVTIIAAAPTYTFTVTATVDRDGVTTTRVVLTGAVSASDFTVTFASPLADGDWFADGVLMASGFPPE